MINECKHTKSTKRKLIWKIYSQLRTTYFAKSRNTFILELLLI